MSILEDYRQIIVETAIKIVDFTKEHVEDGTIDGSTIRALCGLAESLSDISQSLSTITDKINNMEE